MESDKPFSSQKLDGGKGTWGEVAADLFGFLSDQNIQLTSSSSQSFREQFYLFS